MRWIGEPTDHARHLMLNTAILSVLSHEHDLSQPVLRVWNDDHHFAALTRPLGTEMMASNLVFSDLV